MQSEAFAVRAHELYDIWLQAPLQNTAPDWRLGSKGCYDAASLARLQTTLDLNFEAVAQGNITGCLSRPLGHGMEEALKAETLRADPAALGRLMADHTQVHLLSCGGVRGGVRGGGAEIIMMLHNQR